MLLLLLACATDVDKDGVVAELDCDDEDPTLGSLEDDRDCDGFTADEDCDDWAADINPGAEEVFGDDVDNDCDGAVDLEEPVCAIQVTLTDPDGTEHPLDFCATWSWQPMMAFSDLAPAVLTGVEMDLGESGCKAVLSATQLCGPGYYVPDIQVTLQSCPGVDDQTTLTEGVLRIDAFTHDETPTDFDGKGFEALMVGGFGAWGGGWRVDAEFQLGSLQDGVHRADDGCAVSPGDEDGDGFLGLEHGGLDCDDGDGETFPGAAQYESATACMRDADDDGYGDTEVDGDIEPGVDCSDGDPTVWGGAASEEPELCTADVDGDGWGDRALTAPAEAGEDCNDADGSEFPGAVTEATPGECMRDVDGDGWGDILAVAPYDPGNDCNDDDATEYPGAVTEAGPAECMKDDDGDGYGDAEAEEPYLPGTDCNDGDEDEYPGAVTEAAADECMRDDDGDGFGDEDASWPYDAGTDCLDNDPDVHVGTAVNEPTVCGQDDDGDGWAAACTAPTGADRGNDCNDYDGAEYPGAVTEATSGECMQDDDGDGYGSDTPSSNCYDAGSDCYDGDPTYWPDAPYTYPGAAYNETSDCATDVDGDGWAADSTHYTTSYGRTEGTDCDDAVGGVYPGAASQESALCTVDADGDGYGDEATTDTYSKAEDGTDCDDGDATVNPDSTALETYDGVDSDCDGDDITNTPQTDIASYGYALDTTTSGTADALMGQLVMVGDWDNDGEDDLFVGGSTYRTDDAYLLHGPISSWDLDLYNAPTMVEDYSMWGAGMGDLDGDGNTDLAVRGYGNVYPDFTYGGVWFGPMTGTLDINNVDVDLDRGDASCSGWPIGAYDDEEVQIADVDGDGQDDLVVGMPTWSSVCNGGLGIWNGALFVQYGPITTDVELDDSELILVGKTYPDMVGRRPDVADDLDGDGVDDIVTGTSRDTIGHVFTDVSGISSGYLANEATIEVQGNIVTGAGDWDNDGYGDLVYGSNYGRAGVITGASTLGTSPWVTFSSSEGNRIGIAVAGDGDFDGDGNSDIAVHAYDTAYLFYGGVSGSYDLDQFAAAKFEFSDTSRSFAEDGHPLEFGDFDHDGLDDLVIGVPTTPLGSNSTQWFGGVWIVLGQ